MTVHKIIWKIVDSTNTWGSLLYGKYDVINIKKLILEGAWFHFSYSVFNIIHTLINQSCGDIMFTRRMTLPRISAKLNRC